MLKIENLSMNIYSKIYLLLLPKVCELIFSRWPRHVDLLFHTTRTVDDVGCTATATKFSSRFDFMKAKQPNNKPKQRRSAVQGRQVDLCLYEVSEKKTLLKYQQIHCWFNKTHFIKFPYVTISLLILKHVIWQISTYYI